MRIMSLAWSDKRKNQLVNFYVVEDDRGEALVLSMPFSMNSTDDFRKQYDEERIKRKEKPYAGPLLQVCFDMSSGRLYLPNGENPREIDLDDKMRKLFLAARLKAEKIGGSLPLAPVIRGDPYSTLRVRRVEDFPSAAAFIRKQMVDRPPEEVNAHMELPVIEADMSKMPTTARKLPRTSGLQRQGVFVSEQFASHVEFSVVEEVDGKKREMMILSQKTPFILINISPSSGTTPADKERMVVLFHKEYAAESNQSPPTMESSPELQTIKHLMYIGWSMRELCLWMLGEQSVADVSDFAFKGTCIYNAAKMLAKEGHADLTSTPYYFSFKTENFPIRFTPGEPGQPMDMSRHPAVMQILHYDQETSMITLRTPLFIPQRTAEKVFNAKSQVFVSQYDPRQGVVKTEEPIQNLMSQSRPTARAVAMDVKNNGGKADDQGRISFRSRFLSMVDVYFDRKHITDYPQATDIIKRLCDRMSNETTRRVKFDDIEVIVGPWARVLGNVEGGYYDLRRFQMHNIPIPYEVFPGFSVSPPCIFIDVEANPNVASRVNVLVHEYQHHINHQLWIGVGKDDKYTVPTPGDTQSLLDYLDDENERVAHRIEFMYMLGTGMSKEDILRRQIGGTGATMANLPVARKYMEIINEAEELLKKDLEDKGTDIAVKRTMNAPSEDLFDPQAMQTFFG